ncbi:MAG: glycosyltransferase family 39 protein [Chloroflexi bacterium]|nr:glycosyltransferase family 39 protein [Chloroflexota bacterium]
MPLQQVYVPIAAILAAVVADVLLMRWLGRYRPADSAEGQSVQEVRVLGAFSPVLTWMKYRRVPPLKKLEPPAAMKPATMPPQAEADGAVNPMSVGLSPELNYRITLIVILAGAVGLTAVGQQILSGPHDVATPGVPYVLSGIGLFVLGRYLYMKHTLPRWMSVVGAPFRVMPFQLLLLALALGCANAAGVFAGGGPKMIHPWAALGAWFAAIALVVVGAYRAGEARDGGMVASVLGPPWSRREVALVAVLFVFSLLVRWIDNGTIPRGLSGDEGSAGLSAVSFLEGRFDNPFTVSWYEFPSLFFVVPAVAIRILGNNYEALRTPSAIAGALTVVGLYWFARPFFGRAVAGLSATLLSGLAFHIHFSRIGLNNIWDALFAVWALGAFWRGWQTGGRWNFIAAGLLIGLSQYFYTSARLIPVVISAWLVLKLLTDFRRVWRRLPDLLSMGLAAVVVFLPLGLHFLSHPEDFVAPVVRFSILTNGWLENASLANHQPAWQLLAQNFRDSALGFTTIPMQMWYNSGKPMLLALPAGLFILGVTLALLNFRDSRYWLLLLWLAGVVTIGALTDNTPAGQRYVIGAPVAALLVALPLASLAHWVIEAWPSARLMTFGAVAVVTLAAMGLDLNFYFREYTPGFRYGDANTEVASKLAQYLSKYPAGSEAYFFGAPRMGYDGFSTLPYLAPQAQGHDVIEALGAPPDWPLNGPRTAFAFLPERQNESAFVTQRYPLGRLQWFYADDGQPLFLLYEVGGN